MDLRSQFRFEILGVRITAVTIALMGGLNVFSALTPAMLNRWQLVQKLFPLEVLVGGRLTATMAGFFLLMLSRNLWLRKRAAWLLTILALVISVISHLLKGFDYEEAILGGILIGWLILMAPHFHARSDRPSIFQGIRVFLFTFGFTLIYGMVGFYLLDRHFGMKFGWLDSLGQTIRMFVEFNDPGLAPVTRFGKYFNESIYLISALTSSYALLMLVRPVLIREPASEEARNQARFIVQKYGRTSLARFTVFPDKSFYFSSGEAVAGTAMVAFQVQGQIALALGDPIGPPEEIPMIIEEFANFCRRNGWRPAFYQTLPDYLPIYRRLGMETICIGNEAIIELASFKTEGNSRKGLRTPINRLLKLGFTAKVYEPPLEEDLIQELKTVSDEWLTMAHGSEKRFSLGAFEAGYLRECPVMVIYDATGRAIAFANVVPEYCQNGVAIDLMRRRVNSESGVMEFLIVHFIFWAQSKGYEWFSLGLSALAGVGEAVSVTVAERALQYIY
ncbi:MAG TPA: phosphatidylglycerol lysyltransferase domain-containing protein, partial [Bacillota bacterium]|nr:phosphatidylglycerol lysyltransferase domain-containing protein [Bacillota bacterium]